MNNFAELQYEITLNSVQQILSANIKMKHSSMDQVMDIDKLNEFNLSKKS